MRLFPERALRQREIVPPEALSGCRATVIGVGAIGRQVALQLAALGMPHLQLIDFDVVEPVNLAPQGYFEEDLGKLKVAATAELARKLHSGLTLDLVPQRFKRSTRVGNVLFCCVDGIETRQRIWEAVGAQVRFFADARMSAEVVRVLQVADPRGRRHYPTTLFAAAAAFTGACTARSTVFTANLAAALMVAGWAQFLRGIVPEPDVTLNLLAWELTAGAQAPPRARSSERPRYDGKIEVRWKAQESITGGKAMAWSMAFFLAIPTNAR